jgi:hypothetical protein
MPNSEFPDHEPQSRLMRCVVLAKNRRGGEYSNRAMKLLIECRNTERTSVSDALRNSLSRSYPASMKTLGTIYLRAVGGEYIVTHH